MTKHINHTQIQLQEEYNNFLTNISQQGYSINNKGQITKTKFEHNINAIYIQCNCISFNENFDTILFNKMFAIDNNTFNNIKPFLKCKDNHNEPTNINSFLETVLSVNWDKDFTELSPLDSLSDEYIHYFNNNPDNHNQSKYSVLLELCFNMYNTTFGFIQILNINPDTFSNHQNICTITNGMFQ